MSKSKRGAPNKKGLDYFPKLTNFYDDDKIFDLMDEYGPLGVTIYDVILTIVYSQGYYIELSKDKLSRMVIRKIGNKWIKNKRVVVQVIDYCAELGLLRKDLLAQNVITSEGIQKRYHKVAVKLMKRQLYTDQYWLLKNEEEEEPLLNSPQNGFSSEENRINSEENQINSEESTIKEKEKKINNYIYFSNPELQKSFVQYISMRNSKMDGDLTDVQVEALRKELVKIGNTDEERISSCNAALSSGWQHFYPVHKKRRDTSTHGNKKNSFHNFDQREYSAEQYKEIEQQLINNINGVRHRG